MSTKRNDIRDSLVGTSEFTRRGWSRSMRQKLLTNPVSSRGTGYRSGQYTYYYCPKKVREIELTEEWKTLSKSYLKRREAALKRM